MHFCCDCGFHRILLQDKICSKVFWGELQYFCAQMKLPYEYTKIQEIKLVYLVGKCQRSSVPRT